MAATSGSTPTKSAAAAPAGTSESILDREFSSPQEIVNVFRQLQQHENALESKIGDIQREKAEHERVISILGKLEGTRKCFRLIGGVLAYRYVSDVKPAVAENLANVSKLLDKLVAEHRRVASDRARFQAKHKIQEAPASGYLND